MSYILSYKQKTWILIGFNLIFWPTLYFKVCQKVPHEKKTFFLEKKKIMKKRKNVLLLSQFKYWTLRACHIYNSIYFPLRRKKNPQKANKQIVSRLKRRQVLRIRMVCLCLAFHLFLSFVNYIKCIGYLSLVKSSPGFCFFHINVMFPCTNPFNIWNNSLF